MTHDRSGQALPPLRLAIVTTARLPPPLADTFYQRFGLALNETYGIIEVGLPAINLEQPRTKQGSVGKLLPDYAIKLVRQPDNTAEEIQLQGPGLLDAYYTPWQPRAAILQQHNGWLATGDLGVMDDAGFLTIVGRCKDMISVAGMKFFPQEVETVLERHPAIQAACVFGVKVARLGETPMAHLVITNGTEPPSETALKDYCTKYLASYKIPSHFQWVKHLTRTASGKLIRSADKLNTNQ
jgi:long-chain acyl-CoA synthetase